MNMINVLQRLAELDANNPNVAPAKLNPEAAVQAVQKTLSEELSVDSLRYLSGVKQSLEECGMMPGMPAPMPTPASFSVNATAASGDEVANMISQIMNLAGAKPVGGHDMPLDAEPKVFSNNGIQQGGELAGNDGMKRMMDMMNEPEDEGIEDSEMPDMGAEEPMDGGLGPMDGAEEPMDTMGGEEPADDTGTGPIGDVDIAGVGGALAGAAVHGDAEGAADGMDDGKNATYSGGEDMRKLIDAVMQPKVSSVDNTPAEPTSAQPFDSQAREYNPNSGGGGDRMDGNMPKGRVTAEDAVTAKLFSEYEKFVTEGKKIDQNKDGKNDWEDVKIARMKASGAMPKDGKVKEASHQASTTMKHVKNPTAGEKKAAKDIKPGVAGYQDRVAMLKSAEKDGRLK